LENAVDGPVLIATDGSPGSTGALKLGIAIARSRSVPAEVLSVLEPRVPVVYGELAAVPEAYSMLEGVQSEELRTAVSAQVAEIDPSADVKISIEVGSPARTIAEFAGRRKASLIVVGSGPRSAVEQWLRSDTSAKIIQLATTPVLIVPESTREVPATALVAVDFSEYSLQAARAVLPILREPGRIFLVHVVWTPKEAEPLPSLGEYWETYREGAVARLEKLASELRQPASRHVETHVMTGDPARELVACAGRFNVDVVAAGSHGQGFFSRILMGSVSTRLIRAGRWPVLIAPPQSAPVYPLPAPP
jgi:nucleotide-binding universal stress UspA family protein